MKMLIAISAGGLALAFLVFRCKLGVHGPTQKAFVGSSWQPDLYIDVCARCGQQVYARSKRGDRG